MKILLLIMIPLVVFMSCKERVVKRLAKHTTVKHKSLISTQSYAVISCDSCKTVYHTPGKIENLNISGTSPKLVYRYSSGKTLKANIYALGQDQDIMYTVYDPDGQIVYHNNLDQPADDAWDVDVLLP